MTESVQYNDPTPNNFPDDYNQKDVDSRTALRTKSIRNKMYGKDVREAIADGVEISSVVSGQAKKTADDSSALSKDTQAQFKAVQQGATSDTEVKTARYSKADGKTYDVLTDRLDAMDAKPQQAVDNLQIGGRNLIIASQLANGYIDDLGNISNGGDTPFTTGIIDTGSNQDIIITKAGKVIVVGEYDSDKKFVEKNRIENSDMYYQLKTGTETKYVRVTFGFSKKDYGAPYKVEKGNKATDWTPAPEDSHHHQAFRKGTRFFAHRGALSIAPENSLPAIRKAGNHAGVEIDIHVTSDGHWMVMHDGTVDRMTNGSGNVSSFTFADIRKLRFDVGSRLGHYSDSDLIIPTLEEVLTICKDQRLIPVVEIKVDSGDNYTSDNWDSLANVITKFGLQDEMMFISFNYQALQEVKKRLPLVEVSYLVSSITTDNITQAQQLGVNAGLDVNYTDSSVNAASVQTCHNAGLKVGVWTTNDDSKRNTLVGYGVDFITTNSLSGERRWANLIPHNGWVNYNDEIDSVVQEVASGIINIHFVMLGDNGNVNKGVPFAEIPDWAKPSYDMFNSCVLRTSDGVIPTTFDIIGTELRIGFNWDKKQEENGWVSGNITYHV